MTTEQKASLTSVHKKQLAELEAEYTKEIENLKISHSGEIEKILDELQNAEAELKANPTSEARGIAWMDVYWRTDSGRVAKKSLTGRSDIGPIEADKRLGEAIKRALEQGWTLTP